MLGLVSTPELQDHQRFFHVFVLWGSTFLFDKYLTFQACSEEAKEHQEEFREAGFHGCVGSTDATHLGMLRCPFKL
jgi:hypothetical protein